LPSAVFGAGVWSPGRSEDCCTCPRCGYYLRAGHAPDRPTASAYPCRSFIATCAPRIDGRREPAPSDVNLVELIAGLALSHDALRLGQPLYLREALAAHGVDADHVKVWQTVGKLRRRHGLVLRGRPREPGDAREAKWRGVARLAGQADRRRPVQPTNASERPVPVAGLIIG
jgi:hypothetical protein